MPDPKFLEIPLHLLSTILAKLECMQSLGAAILSHSSIYAAFHEDAKHIVQCILRSQIPAELMHYAAAAFESSINDNSVRRMGLVLLAAAFNNQFRPENGPPFQKWCLDWMFDHSLSGIGVRAIFARSHSWDIPEYDALDANTIASMFSKTHAVVEHFCSRFLAERLPLWQGLRGQLRPGNGCPSEKELLRIKRALYLFQIYCNMNFPHGGGFETTEEARDIQAQYVKCYILGSFSPWVNEQLACVHDFLEEVLSASFDEVAAHDIHWGAESVDWLAQGREGEHKQAYLTYGLPFLFELDQSRTYEHRLELLGRKGLPRTRTALAAHLGGSSLIYWNRYDIPNRAALGDREFWTPTQLAKLVGRREGDRDGADGLGSGPSRTWLETNKDFVIADTPYWPENSYLRRCGYVMWDVPASEADDLGVDDEVRRWIEEGRRRGVIEKAERSKGLEEMEQSWKERAILYNQGKRGYWEPGS